MLVSDIIAEVKEGIGMCETDFALRVITRAVQLLANKGLVDPLIGYFDFSLEGSYFVALPRAVKTVLRVNINKQPAFARARLYEFHINSEGTTDEEDPGMSWADRGYSPIQDERKLPGKLKYKTTATADNGKTCTVIGLDEDGRQQEETLTGHNTTPTEGTIEFHKIERVIREATTEEAFLWCNGTNIIAQYYADETAPNYRVIKLSKTAAAARVMFRRNVYSVRTVNDFIPLHSELAVIEACKAVRFLAGNEYDKAEAALKMAEQFHREEQASREEHNTIAENQEIQPAIDASMLCRDSIIVADVYDCAARIFGAVGRRKIFDYLTGAIELLSNKGQWDARLGVVDVFTADNTGATTYDTPLSGTTNKGHGYYVLPRHVEAPIAISYRCAQSIPRNRWFEFHMNGDEAMPDRSTCRAWDDCGEVCLIRPLPLDPDQEPKDRSVLPTYLVAVPDSNADDGTEVRIYGFERDANGRDIEVWRGGERGWLCPCVAGSFNPGEDAPQWTAVERITKGESRAFIRLYAAVPTVAVTPETDEATITALAEIPEVLTGDVPPLTHEPSGLTVTPTWALLDDDDAVYYWAASGQVADTTFSWTLFNGDGDVVAFLENQPYVVEVDTGFSDPTPPTFLVGSIPVSVTPNGSSALFAIQRVVTPASSVTTWAAGELYGLWYPDEVEPKYRMIRLPHHAPRRIRLAYRKRTPKVSGLYEPIPLRSRLAIEQALRAIKAYETDPAAGTAYEMTALRHLREERINQGISATGILQFDESTSPGFTGNIQ